jgi:sulfatase modifying factor 1
MKTIAALTLLTIALLYVPTAQAAIIDTFGTGTNTFTMTFEPIGNPGNAPDTTGNPNPAGSVAYAYNMGKYEVSRDMINKANAEDDLGITLWNMISFGGNGANRPATGVSWNEAARFVNWLNTSQGYSPAYKFDLQPGDVGYNVLADITLWQATDSGFNSANRFRNSLARYFLPSIDEWYKAAYFDPNANGGSGGYWNYPYGSDTRPSAVSGGTTTNSAVYGQPINQGPADVDNAGGLSPYGLVGLGGNVLEWQETGSDLVTNNSNGDRVFRGGSWFDGFSTLSASLRYRDPPSNASSRIGFRVASIPEPSSAVLLTLAFVGLWQRKRDLAKPLPT